MAGQGSQKNNSHKDTLSPLFTQIYRHQDILANSMLLYSNSHIKICQVVQHGRALDAVGPSLLCL